MLAGFYADFGNFVAKTGTVVVAEDMGGQVIYERKHWRTACRKVHFVDNGFPHLVIGRFCYHAAGGAIKEICSRKGGNIPF